MRNPRYQVSARAPVQCPCTKTWARSKASGYAGLAARFCVASSNRQVASHLQPVRRTLTCISWWFLVTSMTAMPFCVTGYDFSTLVHFASDYVMVRSICQSS
jgi:hypothetical protein